MSNSQVKERQGLLFSEPSIAETGVWCALNEGIEPVEWASLCRFLGKMSFDEFKKDSRIKDLLSRGKTMGCFYVESPAMRMLLGKLRCDNYTTLVAASSIIRPGVARSGMMREYIYRHHNPDGYTSIHPQMDDLMKETYGVMVYQEDVSKVAVKMAGFTHAQGDGLRKIMSKKEDKEDVEGKGGKKRGSRAKEEEV